VEELAARASFEETAYLLWHDALPDAGQLAGFREGLAALRSLGLPAAYVSGLLCTRPPPGKERLEGADAMHAWVSVWLGAEMGWQDIDPTNAVLVGEDHIRIAVGREYADVAPIDGVIVAAGDQSHDVAVDVVPLRAPADTL